MPCISMDDVQRVRSFIIRRSSKTGEAVWGYEGHPYDEKGDGFLLPRHWEAAFPLKEGWDVFP